jgi:hypothetical protein
MRRPTVRIVPTISSDSSCSSCSSDTLGGWPVTPQFLRVMREYNRNGSFALRDYSYEEDTTSELDVDIKCQNRCIKCGCFSIFGVILVAIGMA